MSYATANVIGILVGSFVAWLGSRTLRGGYRKAIVALNIFSVFLNSFALFSHL